MFFLRVLPLLLPLTSSISPDSMFKYGLRFGDQTLPINQEDVSSEEIHLSTDVNFFARKYQSIFVNENGLLSFHTEIPKFYNGHVPMNYPHIAVFYSDVDTRLQGEVYYRASNTSEDINKAVSLIQNYFGMRFEPKEMFIATWDEVGRYKSQNDEMNTFQAALASDGQETYLFMLYPENKLEWIKGQGKEPNSPEANAQVGIISSEGPHLLHRYSGRNQITKIDQWSNTDQPGLWMYKIGPLQALENVIEPTRQWQNDLDPESATSCTLGATTCHSNAECVDYNPGFCCRCLTGYFGNGDNCLQNGLPQRGSGAINGIMNGVEMVLERDLHCYIATQDGRTYTAISRVPRQIGWDLQALLPIGNAISWLFAIQQDGGLNGFTLTGGVFNYTAEVYFPDTGHRATIIFTCKGLDFLDALKADLYLKGNVPPIPVGADLRIEDFFEDFTKVNPGEIHARSKRQYEVQGTNRIVQLDVEHTITYEDCASRPDNADLKTLRLMSSSNYISYDEDEQIIRYASASHVKPLGASENPCLRKDCGPNSNCFIDGLQPRCECKIGFLDYDPNDFASICEDKDECADPMTNICSRDARCINTQGSFTCECNQGFVGNGTVCQREVTCEELQCNENAQCVTNHYRQKVCVCNEGYQGDGKQCTVIPSLMSIQGYAHPELHQEVRLELVSDVRTLEDLGPEVTHFYEIVNKGPYAVGRIQVDVTWPLQDDEGDSIMYLTNKPFVSYESGGSEVILECEGVDDAIVNPLGLSANIGRKKRESLKYDESESDHKYANMEYAYGYVEGNTDLYDEYDYSHLEQQAKSLAQDEDVDPRLSDYYYEAPDPVTGPVHHAESDQPVMGSPGSDQIGVEGSGHGSNLPESPESGRVVMAPTEMPLETTTRALRPGQVNFFCRVNLAKYEVAKITIKSRINTQTLNRKYGRMSTFVIESNARFSNSQVTDKLIEISGPEMASAVTVLEVSEPFESPKPGSGIQCGTDICHKYATCTVSFATIDLDNCRCAPGFTGDGVTCEQSQEHIADCRTDGCSENADCKFEPRNGLYQCLCRDGFKKEGDSCARDVPSCRLLNNCSPYARCQEVQRDDFRCVCEQGFIGDGFSCSRDQRQPSRGGQTSRPATMPPQRQSCDVADNCSPHAICRENRPDDFGCVCDFGYTGDGYNCIRIQQGGSVIDWTPAPMNTVAPWTQAPMVTVAPAPQPTCLFGFCSCEGEYEYDSQTGQCKVDDTYGNSDQCRSKADCHEKANCDYSHDEGRYLCNCFKGYEGDGKTCQPGPDAGCDILENCDKNARCLLNEMEKQYYCRCNNGYSGTGEHCVKDKQIGCNVRNNCDKYANCQFDPYERDYRCICDAARGFTGDGHTCTPESCLMNPAVCSPDADCVPMANQEYGCRCKRNFFGDGLECEPSPRQDGNFMLLGQGMFVLNVPFVGKGSKPINVLSSQVATGIDIDCMKGLVYWSDTTNKVIRRSNIDGSNQEIFLDGDMKFPEGIAIDWVSRNVYWTDPGKDTIEVANMDTRERRVIFRDDLRQPRSIVVHPGTGNIIWTDWDRTRPKIEISGMDGSERRTLVNVNLGEPNFLTTDYPNYQVCWTDGGSKKFHVTPRVDCIGIPHGGGRRTILELTAGEFPYGLAMTENNVYWTDWKKKMIHSADKISGERQRSINYPLAGIGGKPYDLVNVPEECPLQRSSCQDVSCPGTMLCLPSERGHTCACSDQEKLQGCVDINY